MTSQLVRHRVLAGVSRSRLLAVLRQASDPMGIRQLAEAVELHPNTAREHLEQLVSAGLVVRELRRSGGRGRPGIGYRLASNPDDEDPQPYRALARVLADELARRPDARVAAQAAGERWGRELVAQPAPADDDPVATLTDILEDAGFSPERPLNPGETIRLRSCPFGRLARDRGEVVCSVHLGLMRGALQQLGAPFDGVQLEPFVEPTLCLAHVSREP